MSSSNTGMVHYSAMLPPCNFYLPICTALPSVYGSSFFLLSALRAGRHSLGCCFGSVKGWWSSWSLPCLAGVSWLSSQQSWPGLGSHPPAQPCYLAGCLCWSNCFWQKSSCTFRAATLNADCWNGRRQLLTLPSGKAQFTKDVLSSDPSWAMRVQRAVLNSSFFY